MLNKIGIVCPHVSASCSLVIKNKQGTWLNLGENARCFYKEADYQNARNLCLQEILKDNFSKLCSIKLSSRKWPLSLECGGLENYRVLVWGEILFYSLGFEDMLLIDGWIYPYMCSRKVSIPRHRSMGGEELLLLFFSRLVYQSSQAGKIIQAVHSYFDTVLDLSGIS